MATAIVDTGLPVILGAFTPSEIMTVLEANATAIKLFPAALGGPALLRSLSGPFPEVSWVPTGDVSVDNLDEWLLSGASAVGVGGEPCSGAAIRDGQWAELERRAARFRIALDAARKSHLAAD
jgi:2-dehydro-3-deoxyphosphogluconate aldolase / (4S)-4-hydroxy-2-oxoglutarate aldolase